MWFALRDFFHYRKRTGRYEKDISKSGSLMGHAFDGAIPEKLLPLLKPGDIICIQNFGWWVSWLIMYLTGSSVSHITFYLGSRTIAHMTLDGLAKESIEALYTPEARILPFIWFMPSDKRKKIEEVINSSKDKFYYDKGLVLKKGLNIIFGRDWSLYRWTFLSDITLTLLLLDLPILYFTRFPTFSLLIPLYLLLLVINWMLRARKPVHVSYPEQFINWLFTTGQGIPLLDIHLSRLQSKQARPEHDR